VSFKSSVRIVSKTIMLQTSFLYFFNYLGCHETQKDDLTFVNDLFIEIIYKSSMNVKTGNLYRYSSGHKAFNGNTSRAEKRLLDRKKCGSLLHILRDKARAEAYNFFSY